MYWLILLGVLGQTPGTSTPRTIAEIRQSLNRFDELDKVALGAKAKDEAEAFKSLPNKERRLKVQERVKGFAVLDLSVPLPYQDAEFSMIDNLCDDACKLHDITPKQSVATRQWYDTSHGKVWGWQDQTTGYVHYYQQEQPVGCSTGRCYGK